MGASMPPARLWAEPGAGGGEVRIPHLADAFGRELSGGALRLRPNASSGAPGGVSGLEVLAEPAPGRVRDERLVGARPELLDRPRVAVRVGEAEERASVAGVDDLDLGALDPPADELVPGRRRVGDDELDAVQRPGRHRLLRRQVPDDDRAAGPARRELRDVHVFVLRLVIEVEADLVPVEGDGGAQVADRDDDHLQGPVHGTHPRAGAGADAGVDVGWATSS